MARTGANGGSQGKKRIMNDATVVMPKRINNLVLKLSLVLHVKQTN